MKVIDAIVSRIAILFLGFLGVLLILLPFENNGFFTLDNVETIFVSLRENYLYSVAGMIIVALCIKALLSGLLFTRDRKNYIITPMNFGDLKISDEAIEGLTENVVTKVIGIRSSKILVYFKDDLVSIDIKGQVAPDVNIPSVTREIQEAVKTSVEMHTGIPVSRVNLDVLSISSPIKSLK